MKKNNAIETNQTIEKINYSDWLTIKDRFSLEKISTIKYATKKRITWEELSQYETSENILHAVDAALINGQLHKINGIIRKGMWEKRELKKPESLIMRTHNINENFYQALIDSLYPISARNKSQDSILACYKKHELNFKSVRLKHGYINDALNIALRGEPRILQDKRVLKNEISTDLAIKNFKKELIIIDKINPNTDVFLSGVLAASLIMINNDPSNIEFFIKLNNYEGITKDEKHDPIEALLRVIEIFKRKKGSEGKIQIELCSKTIRAISAWKLGEKNEGYWIKRLSSINFLPDIRKMKMLKKIHGNKDL